jgi:hypothetical protein
MRFESGQVSYGRESGMGPGGGGVTITRVAVRRARWSGVASCSLIWACSATTGNGVDWMLHGLVRGWQSPGVQQSKARQVRPEWGSLRL